MSLSHKLFNIQCANSSIDHLGRRHPISEANASKVKANGRLPCYNTRREGQTDTPGLSVILLTVNRRVFTISFICLHYNSLTFVTNTVIYKYIYLIDNIIYCNIV